MSAKRFTKVRHFSSRAIFVAALVLSFWTAYRTWPRRMQVSLDRRLPSPELRGGRLVLPISKNIACARIGTFHDQLEAFLRFEYLRGRDPEDAPRIFLTSTQEGKQVSYEIFLLVENDRLTAEPRLSQMKAHGLIADFEFAAWTKRDLALAEQQSRMLEEAYNIPARQKLETVPSFQLLPALADFLVFKSQTDWRVVGQNSNAPQPLTHRQALRLASDILDVAHFYSLPLDYFLGVGAMENNYMDVDGDLKHAVWKHRAERGDIVLERGRKRVLVSDYSIGTWQISRETLRAAHQLYLKDKRDYTQLPPRLRPPRQLDVNSMDSAVLTTYAGFVLRELLDRFDGDVDQAIGAYNGGARNPNPAYSAGVKNVALYARKMLEHAPLPPARPVPAVLANDTVL